ncbi:hypothetical protein Rhe02_03000 [Rhizocola hellebori]|uniref:Phage tail sheath family protein n=2 Tax=Rhizocola hellebori TaxID=1392758 RepID=A0A8J3VDG4_9ACTN|nr:hypothetical protein Rhe02_03000 [Rhizocola hellebori]
MGPYDAPGIYVEEVPGGARPIAPVGTSTAGFVGRAPTDAAIDEPKIVNSWADYLRIYCEKKGNETLESTDLTRAVFGFFDNGGSTCWVVNIGNSKSITGTQGRRSGLDLFEAIDEIAIVAAPGFADIGSHIALTNFAANQTFPMAILDPTKDRVTDVSQLLEVETEGGSPQSAPAAAKPPDKKPPEKKADKDSESDSAEGAEGADTPAPPATPPAPTSGGGLRPATSVNAAFYFPRISIKDPFTGLTVNDVPPSGHIAGVWARTDALRGVHKAPANEPLRGATGVAYRVTRQDQERLNPQGVNCIRYFASEGIRVWGAKTLTQKGDPWEYINVRRLFNAVGRSIELGTGWMVFEPNDYTLWRSIKRDITAYLTGVWRDGALLGRTPQEAFFVKCDEETNPPDQRNIGIVMAVIGLAVVKPAEFVVFRLSQWAGGSQTEVVGG